MSDEKTVKRWVVECNLDTENGTRRSISRPLMRAQADELAKDLRESGVESTSHERIYTRGQLELAEKFAAMGREADHLGTKI